MSRIDEAMRLAARERAAVIGPGDQESARPAPEDAVPDNWGIDALSDEAAARTASAPPPVEVPPSSDPREEPIPADAASSSRAMALFRGFHPAVLERLVAGSTDSGLAEQYRQLAATLHHAQVAQQIKVVLITSAAAGEGKTLTATNLALTLSESYRRRVLLIDADLRRPSLHDVFQVPNVSGLNEGLQAPSERKLALLQITSTLTLLPAGRPNPDPMSSLTSARMGQILEEASSCFDWVIVDTPPVGLMADANLLAAMADAALLVVRAGRTPFKLVEKTVETIGRDKILGVVLNDTTEREHQTDYYNYRGYGPPA
jgi:capsular exopolysaccharide synthesis family protein